MPRRSITAIWASPEGGRRKEEGKEELVSRECGPVEAVSGHRGYTPHSAIKGSIHCTFSSDVSYVIRGPSKGLVTDHRCRCRNKDIDDIIGGELEVRARMHTVRK